MDETTPKSQNRVLEFLCRRPNLFGTGVSFVSLLVGMEVPEFHKPIILFPVLIGTYVAGYLMGGDYRADVNIQVESKSDKVEIATIRDNIASLRKTVQKYQRRLPDEIIAQVEELFSVLEEILPRWSMLHSFTEQKYTLNAVLTDYLPKTLSNYLNLPSSYYHGAAKHQYGDDVQEQLTILIEAVRKIRDGVYDNVESDIKTQTTFLRDKFTAEDNSGLRLS